MSKAKADNRTAIFESVPIPKAVALLCVPTIISSLVMVLYNLADTYFVGILNDPVQNAAVTLAGPVLLHHDGSLSPRSQAFSARALGPPVWDVPA